MTQQSFAIPSWAPLAAAAAILVWAVGIWWMVATLPAAAGNTDDAAEAAALRIDVGLLTLSVETLTDERDQLLEERAALELRIVDLETALASSLAAATATSEDEDLDGAAEDANEDVTQHPLYTHGADRYNCRDFRSFEEAQEALRVNGPGDPNRIDMNRNGIACEDIRYPAATPTPSAPTAPPAETP